MPKDDNYMKYDYNRHRYYLTPRAAIDLCGANLDLLLDTFGDANSSTLAERFCRKSGNAFYSYVRTMTARYDIMEWIMACDPEQRARVQEMLIEQLEYNLSEAFPERKSGLNIERGSAMRLEDLRADLTVPGEVMSMAQEIMPRYGFSLLCTNYLSALRLPNDKYARYNY